MKIGYIPLGTKVIYRGFVYKTDTACSRALGTIRIMGKGPHDGFFINVKELIEIEIQDKERKNE